MILITIRKITIHWETKQYNKYFLQYCFPIEKEYSESFFLRYIFIFLFIILSFSF